MWTYSTAKELCEDTIEDIMISNQIRDDVKYLIEELPELQKEVLMMRYYQNLSFKGNSGNHGSKHQYCPRKNALCHTQSPTHSPRKKT